MQQRQLNLLTAFIVAIAITMPASAMSIVESPIMVDVPITSGNAKLAGQQYKQVGLMNVKLTPEELKRFTTFPRMSQPDFLGKNQYPSHINLGMNGVPVLDQGRHGSCVTFAITGALDALLGKGDYVSQLCLLELGEYLAAHSYQSSGWHGAIGPGIMARLMDNGYVTKEDQRQGACGRITEYPLKDKENTGVPLPLEDYNKVSHSISHDIEMYPLLSEFERMQWDFTTNKDAELILDKVKQRLSQRVNQDKTLRLTMAMILPSNHCHHGACARYHKEGDTWALTEAIKHDTNPRFGGHEMNIMGYDDDAVAIDNEGRQHKGLLIIRNSWGADAGDNGDFYIAYDFFKQYVTKIHVLVSAKPA